MDQLEISNYSVSFSSNGRWKMKIRKVDSWLKSSELKMTFVVFTKRFVNEAMSTSTENLNKLFTILKKGRVKVYMQEYLKSDTAGFYDFYEERLISEEELIKSYEDSQTDISQKKEWRKDLGEHLDDSLLYEYDKKSTIDNHLRLAREMKEQLPEIKRIRSCILSSFNEVTSFKVLSELQNLIRDELQYIDENEILHIYIPKKHQYVHEIIDLIRSFEEYLKSVEDLSFKVSVNETVQGVSYKFVTNEILITQNEVAEKFVDFKSFIDLCETKPELARDVLESKGFDPNQALEVIGRLTKKYKRILFDIQQKKERLEFQMQQEIQSELFEINVSNLSLSKVASDYSVDRIQNLYNITDKDWRVIELIKKYKPLIPEQSLLSDLAALRDDEMDTKERKRAGFNLKKMLQSIKSKAIEKAEGNLIEWAFEQINSIF
jgi:hypothetical protein